MAYEKELQFAIETVKGAGELVKPYFKGMKPGEMRDAAKGVLSEADLASDGYMHAAIAKSYPDYGIITEESHRKEGNEYDWVGDPIDGTTNFTHGLTDFMIFLSLARRNKPVVGVAYNPVTSELFQAVKGEGAYRNGERIHVSKRKLGESIFLLACDWLFPAQRERGLKLFRLLTEGTEPNKQKVFRPRISEGGSGPCYVARGHYEGYVIDQTKPWDIAAPSLIIEEAGGRVTNHKGGDWDIFTKDILQTNGVVHDEMLAILKRLNE